VRVMNTHPAIKLTFQSSYVSIKISFQKGTKTWIKRSLRVVTWLRYKRKDIYRAIEFKEPSIREHSFYLHSKDKFTRIPLILKKTFGVKT
jgi:hypothetical protein